ncbi:MAG: hypothetical protein ABJC04_01585 [Verrucomicrobiota bacterium]
MAKFDQVEAIQVDQLVGNNLTRTPFDQKVVYLNARCETKHDGQKKYYLFTEVIAPADFTLQPGESLILNIDDEIVALASTNSPSFNGRKRFVTTFYPVQPEMLTKLAKASTVRIRIKGANSVIDKQLESLNLIRFWNFAWKCSLIDKPKKIKVSG